MGVTLDGQSTVSITDNDGWFKNVHMSLHDCYDLIFKFQKVKVFLLKLQSYRYVSRSVCVVSAVTVEVSATSSSVTEGDPFEICVGLTDTAGRL